jgi:hypothetical protein
MMRADTMTGDASTNLAAAVAEDYEGPHAMIERGMCKVRNDMVRMEMDQARWR